MAESKVIPYALMKEIIEDCKDKRTRSLIAFQYAMGNRAGELAYEYDHTQRKDKATTPGMRRDRFFETEDGLEWESPNFKNAKQPKKKAWISKHNEPWLYRVLQRWLKRRAGKKWLFNVKHSRIRGLIDEELKKYDKELHSHCLRHSRATHLGDLSGDIFVVKEVLGHARVDTTSRYINVARRRLKEKLGNKKFEDVLGKKV